MTADLPNLPDPIDLMEGPIAEMTERGLSLTADHVAAGQWLKASQTASVCFALRDFSETLRQEAASA